MGQSYVQVKTRKYYNIISTQSRDFKYIFKKLNWSKNDRLNLIDVNSQMSEKFDNLAQHKPPHPPPTSLTQADFLYTILGLLKSLDVVFWNKWLFYHSSE